MAYSGTTNFTVTRDQICARAAAKLKIVDTTNGETLDSNTLADFAFQLNLLVKETMASPGIIPWVRTFNTLVLQQGQTQFYLGNTAAGAGIYAGPDNWTLSSGLVTTNLAAAGNTGASSITVASTTGLANSMFIGIKLNSGATSWFTILSIVGTTVNLSGGTIPSTANSGNFVYAYTTKADRPQKILTVARRQASTNASGPIDITMDPPISWDQYMKLPNKLQQGTPLQYHFENTLGNAQLTIWYPSIGTDGYDTLVMICDTLIEDFDNSTDNPYYPIEWANYLVWALADEMSDEYPIDMNSLQRITMKADKKFNMLLDYSSELSNTAIQFGLIQNAWV